MKIFNFAHRGARSLAPENSMAAFEKAWEIGTDGVEVDVTVSRDGHLVIHHDTSLGRTTDISEIYPDKANMPVTTFTLDELRRLDNGSWYIDNDPFGQIRAGNISFKEMETFQNSSIPTLEEVLLYVKNKPWRINLELKTLPHPHSHFPITEETIKLIKHLGIADEQVIISSFDHQKIDLAQHLYPAIEINALIGAESYNDWGAYEYTHYNANAAFIDEIQISKAKGHGCTVNLYTVNDFSKLREYTDWGVSGLITDFPQTLASLLNEQ